MKKSTLISIVFSFLALATQMAFANDGEMQVKSPVEASKVNMFAVTTLFAVYDFDHSNILPRQKNAATMFTSDGWANFLSAMNKSKLVDSVKKNKYIVTTTPLRPAKITKQALKYGVYYWDVELPAMIVFKNDDFQQVQYLNIKQRIVFKDNHLQVDRFLATKGEPLNCKETSKGITVSQATKQPAK